MPKPKLNGLELHKLNKNNRKLKPNFHLPPLLINWMKKDIEKLSH